MPFGGGWGLRMSRPRTVLRALEARARAGTDGRVLGASLGDRRRTRRVVRLPAAKRFAHYFRLHGFASRLEAILRGATFGPMGPLRSRESRDDARAARW